MRTMRFLNIIRNIILDISCIVFSGFMIAFLQDTINNPLLLWIISTISVIPLAVPLTNIISNKS